MKATDQIVVLYRDRELQLWGIPYAMHREIGQNPRDIQEAGPSGWVPRGWVWLGSPGWWGTKSAEEIAEVEAFLAEHAADGFPGRAYEWFEIPGRACGAPGGRPYSSCLLHKEHAGDHAACYYRWPRVPR